MKSYKSELTADPSGFVVLADYVPHIVQEIRYYSTYNFIGERIDGYEEPCALLTKEAARALKSVSNEMIVQGYRLKVFDGANLIFALLLAVSLGTHVLTNIKPFAISVGASRVREYIKDILFVLSIVMIFCAAAFIIYFIRWNFL